MPKEFILSLEKTYSILEINPFFKLRYNNIRSLKIYKYPYSLYFIINEENFTALPTKKAPAVLPTDAYGLYDY